MKLWRLAVRLLQTFSPCPNRGAFVKVAEIMDPDISLIVEAKKPD